MIRQILVCILCSLHQTRSLGFSREAHGSREWFRKPNGLSILKPNGTRVVTSGVIVGEVVHDEAGRIINCRFTELRDRAERDFLYKKLGRKAEVIEFEGMITLIRKCGEVVASSQVFPRFANPLLPGTLWCGPGDAAENYGALGLVRGPDACCRDHDLCPIRALPGETTTSKGPNQYTISDCRCDRALKQCLKRSLKVEKGLAAGVVSRIVKIGLGECFAEDGSVTSSTFRFFDILRQTGGD
ncbi:uncharacterized protein LOC100907150 [Galendromus occidentalis]|uniref:Uncharacterized protein LOC100907150 n=1 Tax=Galendromus occidentalis TaxID=34638 RepID=A0AAJ6VZH6_9ACAR|nr:uncharacterized protein LOC100907150 [Galendromus occidentalis]